MGSNVENGKSEAFTARVPGSSVGTLYTKTLGTGLAHRGGSTDAIWLPFDLSFEPGGINI